MERDPLLVALTAEILRVRLPHVEAELQARYTDGGQAGGARRKAILDAINEAYALATEAVTQIR